MLDKKQTKNSCSDQIINGLKPEPSWSLIIPTNRRAIKEEKPSFQRFDSRTIMMFVDNKIKIPAANMADESVNSTKTRWLLTIFYNASSTINFSPGDGMTDSWELERVLGAAAMM